jgi:hypothetical protein
VSRTVRHIARERSLEDLRMDGEVVRHRTFQVKEVVSEMPRVLAWGLQGFQFQWSTECSVQGRKPHPQAKEGRN